MRGIPAHDFFWLSDLALNISDEAGLTTRIRDVLQFQYQMFLSVLLVCFITFSLMEGAAWAMHKYVLHGPLWYLHRSHHEPHSGAFERNDLVILFYAALSAAACMAGGLWLGVGLGVALYGIVYFFVHDVLIHRRIRWFGKPFGAYLRAVDIAHKTHHATKGRDGAQAFGMLWVAARYRQLARRKRAASAE